VTALRPGAPAGTYVELIHTMGTVVTVDVRATSRPPGLEGAAAAVARRLGAIDRAFSTWLPDSWVSRLAAGRITLDDCPEEVRDVVSLAVRMREATGGYFSPFWRGNAAAGPDPTGLVKGWAAQQASDILIGHGLPDHLVNAAGDLVLSGSPAPFTGETPGSATWQVGISDPLAPGGLAGVVRLGGGSSRWAVATSGTAELGYHVVDPHTGAFPREVTSATAVVRVGGSDTEAGAVADACATALVAAGLEADALLGRLTTHRVRAVVLDARGAVSDPHGLLVPILT
jgi:thiamine biosynthesis lipoprotein